MKHTRAGRWPAPPVAAPEHREGNATAERKRPVATWWDHLRFRRIVTSSRYIPELDGFRFLAIAMVIAYHIVLQCVREPYQAMLKPWFSAGAGSDTVGSRGVCLFFTISGFILAMPFARHCLQGGSKVRLGSYFKRRLTRLEPPYVLALLLRFPLVLVVKHLSAGELGWHLLASLLYVHTLVYRQFSLLNPPAWSLEIEVQFYLLAPLLAFIFLIEGKHLRRGFLLLIILFGAFVCAPWASHSDLLQWSLMAFLQYFLAGFLLCDLYLTGDRLPLPAWLWDLAGVAAAAFILFSRLGWTPAVMPFASMLLCLAGFYGRGVRGFFSLRPISRIGGMCYSIYLTHTAVLTAIAFLWFDLFRPAAWGWFGVAAVSLASFAAVLLIGSMFYLLIERPCMNPQWPHQLAVRLGWRAVA